MRQSIEGLKLELAEYQKTNAQRKKDDVGTINELLALSQGLLDPKKMYTVAELQAAQTTLQSKSPLKKSGVFNTPLINKVLNFTERCITYRTGKEAADKKAEEAKAAEERQTRLTKEAADKKAVEEEQARLAKETADRKAAEELQARLSRETADRKAAEEAQQEREKAAAEQQAQLARETSAREESLHITKINDAILKLKEAYLQNGGNRAKADREIFNMAGVTTTDKAAMTAKFTAVVQKLREGKPGNASSKTLPKVPALAEALDIELPPVVATAAPQSRWANFPFSRKSADTKKKPESESVNALTM